VISSFLIFILFPQISDLKIAHFIAISYNSLIQKQTLLFLVDIIKQKKNSKDMNYSDTRILMHLPSVGKLIVPEYALLWM